MAAEWRYTKEGLFELIWEGICVMRAHGEGRHRDGRKIDTRTARLVEQKKAERGQAGQDRAGQKAKAPGGLWLKFCDANGLCLEERLEISPEGAPVASCILSDAEGRDVETNLLTPMVVQAPEKEQQAVWKSIWSKMLLVPYDNTMWLRYEAASLRAGRKSYDMTVMFQEDTREGLLIGAMDFDKWKNAVICSATDAKTLNVCSGVADWGTHDSQPHGSLLGKEVSSARFCILYGTDYRELLEAYGDLIRKERPILTWEEGVPFGFNSWAGLAFRLNPDNYQKTGAFLREELRPIGYENKGVNYCNLDAGWSAFPEEKLIKLTAQLHENGQKAGIYDAPFAFFGKDVQEEIKGVPGHTFEEILLRDEKGDHLPRVDGAIPYDVTHPLWKEYTEYKLGRFLEWGYDYVKLDFMTHGGMEGCHFDKSVRTGREAIAIGYGLIDDILVKGKGEKPFFISLSIAPLFPCGYGHARRFSCDAFGTMEDVEYVLNAQTYAWWQSGRLYQYNDPDHICLLRSFGMERDSTQGEARARYTASAIAGTVMMLSDDYEREEARKRTLQLAGNREINRMAAAGVSFLPVESNHDSASSAYTAVIGQKQYLALFHWQEKEEVVRVDCERAGLCQGTEYTELWSGETMQDEDGFITWKAQGCDAVVLKEK